MEIERPMLNDYCEKCTWHYLLEGDESRCMDIRMGMEHVMCVQVVECHGFIEKKVKKDG